MHVVHYKIRLISSTLNSVHIQQYLLYIIINDTATLTIHIYKFKFMQFIIYIPGMDSQKVGVCGGGWWCVVEDGGVW